MSRPRKQKLPTYSDADFKRIAKAIGKKGARFWSMEVSSRRRRSGTDWIATLQTAWRPLRCGKKLHQISNSARHLLKNLGIEDPADAPDGPGDITIFDALASVDGETGDSVARATEKIGRIVEILEAIEAAQKLERMAKEAITDVTHLGKFAAPKGHQGDAKVNDWIDSMMSIYVKVTGKDPATSVGAPEQPDEGIARGPLIRYLEASGTPLGIKYTPDAWRSRIRTILDNSP